MKAYEEMKKYKNKFTVTGGIIFAVMLLVTIVMLVIGETGNQETNKNYLKEIEANHSKYNDEKQKTKNLLEEIKVIEGKANSEYTNVLKELKNIKKYSIISSGSAEKQLSYIQNANKEIKKLKNNIEDSKLKIKLYHSEANKLYEQKNTKKNILDIEMNISKIVADAEAEKYQNFFLRVLNAQITSKWMFDEMLRVQTSSNSRFKEIESILDEANSTVRGIEDTVDDADDTKKEINKIEKNLESTRKKAQSIFNQETMNKSIVYVTYDVDGKYTDGSYYSKSWSGSGVITDNRDHLEIYTNRHVIDCAYGENNPCDTRISETIKVRTYDGQSHTVNRVNVEEGVDLAILEVNVTNPKKYRSVPISKQMKIGDPIIVIGYPGYAQRVVEFSFERGRITNIKDALSTHTEGSFKIIESDAYANYGSSGGGIFNEDGELLGITTWKSLDLKNEANGISLAGGVDNFHYCGEGHFYVDGGCLPYCDSSQVLGEDGVCANKCEDPYCLSKKPNWCKKKTYGTYYTYTAWNYINCGSSYYLMTKKEGTFCEFGSDYYFKNSECRSCFTGYLYTDGNCYYDKRN